MHKITDSTFRHPIALPHESTAGSPSGNQVWVIVLVGTTVAHALGGFWASPTQILYCAPSRLKTAAAVRRMQRASKYREQWVM